MQNTAIDQIRQKEAEIEKRVQQAQAEADDRLQQRRVEAGLLMKTRQKALDAERQEMAAQVDKEATLVTEKLLAQAKEEANITMQTAKGNMDKAVVLVVRALLDRM